MIERNDKQLSDNEVSTAIKPYEANSNQQQDFHEVNSPSPSPRFFAQTMLSVNAFVQSEKNQMPFNASINSNFEAKAYVPAFESKDFQRLSHPAEEEEDPSEVAPQS